MVVGPEPYSYKMGFSGWSTLRLAQGVKVVNFHVSEHSYGCSSLATANPVADF
jgi:hypothetical protein